MSGALIIYLVAILLISYAIYYPNKKIEKYMIFVILFFMASAIIVDVKYSYITPNEMMQNFQDGKVIKVATNGAFVLVSKEKGWSVYSTDTNEIIKGDLILTFSGNNIVVTK